MDTYRSLLEISRLLVSEEDPGATAHAIVEQVASRCGADRAFIVVRERGSYEQKWDVAYDREGVGAEARRFSRSLVRQAIATREPIRCDDLLLDARFKELESVAHAGARSVLVTPLAVGDEVWGALYLDRNRPGGFSEEVAGFVADLAGLAAHFLRRAIERREREERRLALERDLFAKHDFTGIVTRDPAMLRLLETIAQVAQSDATVLLHGETGTGKELLAQAVHMNSRRSAQPLVTLDCAAMPASLLESELFGHVRGAFSGADRDRAGRIAGARGGTLFLDEIGEIPIDVQAKLLRFLQFGEVSRLGSDRVERVDVRIVAATHRDLRAMVDEGKWRGDLYFRLRVVELEVPPLRARPGDVRILAETFLRMLWTRSELGEPAFTDHVLAILEAHGWPGNVRELRHVVERACVLARSARLGIDLLPQDLLAGMPEPVAPPEVPPGGGPEAFTAEALERARAAALAQAERDFLTGLMERCEGNVSRASREAGIHRSYLQRLLARHRPG